MVSASWSGKSAANQPVEHMYDPDQGTAKLDGYDLKTLNVYWLRQLNFCLDVLLRREASGGSACGHTRTSSAGSLSIS